MRDHDVDFLLTVLGRKSDKAYKLSPASQLAAMRRKETKPCAHCGEPFTGLKRSVYCSGRCRQGAKRKRDKQ